MYLIWFNEVFLGIFNIDMIVNIHGNFKSIKVLTAELFEEGNNLLSTEYLWHIFLTYIYALYL